MSNFYDPLLTPIALMLLVCIVVVVERCNYLEQKRKEREEFKKRLGMK